MRLLRQLHSLFRRNQLEREMAEEMRLHLELQTEKNVAAGMDPKEARYAAQRQFGNVGSIREQARETRGFGGVERLFKDVNFGLRNLRKTPVFTLSAVVTLAVGIGLTTAAFSLLNAILLRPLPFDRSEFLVRVNRSTSENSRGAFSPADYLELKRGEAPFGTFAAFGDQNVSLSENGRPAEYQEVRRVSADYFRVLGIQPEIGRAFLPGEEVYGRHRVVILSHAFWETRFGGSADAIGRTVRIDGEENEIVGVLPRWASDAHVNRDRALFRPLAFTPEERAARDHEWVNVIGRRAASVSEAAGKEFVAVFGQHVAAQSPAPSAGVSWHCEDLLKSMQSPNDRPIIGMLLGLSGFVLLIACSNLANFLLARTIGRGHELAVRAGIGASRLQLIRPLLVEALLLALAGGVLALFVSSWAGHWLSNQSVASGGAPMDFPIDWRVLAFALGAAGFTAIFFGGAPALFAMRVDVNDALKRGIRGVTASRQHNRLRQVLVIGQFAMALILVTGAGLFASGASNFLQTRVGWDSRLIAQGSFELTGSKYTDQSHIIAFHRLVLEKLHALPGVEAASLGYGLPCDGPFGPRGYLVEGRAVPPQGAESMAAYNGVSDDFFSVTGIRLVRGRIFNTADSTTGRRVIIINESMAAALFPDGNALGRHLATAGTDKPEWAEIIGVVTDVRSHAVYRRPIAFQVYHPLANEPWSYARFAVRVSGSPESVLSSLRKAISDLDPDLPVRDLMTADAMIEHWGFELVMMRNMLGTFALLGLGLAVLGIYGVISRSVAQRSAEIGIRMALGATTSDVVALVVRGGVRLALIGAAMGIFGAFGLTRFLANLMPALEPNNRRPRYLRDDPCRRRDSRVLLASAESGQSRSDRCAAVGVKMNAVELLVLVIVLFLVLADSASVVARWKKAR